MFDFEGAIRRDLGLDKVTVFGEVVVGDIGSLACQINGFSFQSGCLSFADQGLPFLNGGLSGLDRDVAAGGESEPPSWMDEVAVLRLA